ncbi:hypothetical protein DYU11_01550 [Fibrisoma montanum]|uniref:Uncharacterized protein n=2 Tax=Fibrisoma montanum TaxID=2305895 RepID=A0A418MHW5_9BACT|nr:hypothetical protein DYU11_01550 [Fibrisoma montanum]
MDKRLRRKSPLINDVAAVPLQRFAGLKNHTGVTITIPTFMKNAFLSLAFLGLMASCSQQTAVAPTQPTEQKVAYQKSVRLAGNSLGLKVAQIADSRCPINARCITAGAVKVQFEASAQGTTQAVDVTLPAYPEKPVETSFTINNQTYRLTLNEVLPYPEAGKEIKLEEYTVQVSVEKQ